MLIEDTIMRLTATLAAVAALNLSGVAQASPAAAPDPVRIGLARQLVEASGGRQQAEATLKVLYGGMGKALSQGLPADQSQLATVLMQDMQDEMIKLVPQILEASIQIYAATLTETELRDDLAWMQSASGRSTSAKMPALRQQLLLAEMPMVMTLMPKLVQKSVDHACDQSQCTPEQRRAVADVVAGGAR